MSYSSPFYFHYFPVFVPFHPCFMNTNIATFPSFCQTSELNLHGQHFSPEASNFPFVNQTSPYSNLSRTPQDKCFHGSMKNSFETYDEIPAIFSGNTIDRNLFDTGLSFSCKRENESSKTENDLKEEELEKEWANFVTPGQIKYMLQFFKRISEKEMTKKF